MDSSEVIIYLKQFVKLHPGNQMGWYLLGKQLLLKLKMNQARKYGDFGSRGMTL